MARSLDARDLIDGRWSADPQAHPAAQAAAQQLAEGRLLGLPTETVYGLAARADDDAAVAAIFAAKGRPSEHPLIVHLPSAASGVGPDEQALRHYAAATPEAARHLMQTFWPGPLTLILPRRPEAGRAAAGGQDSIGLRCPAHPVAQAVLHAAAALGVLGVAAPSANRFGRVSPTRAQHVLDEFEALDDAQLLVLDGGACRHGIESTIVDLSRGRAVLLRPGTLAREALEAAAGQPLLAPDAQAPRASGTLESHYAPRAQVRLMDARQLQQGLDLLGADARHMAVYARAPLKSASRALILRRMPDDASACAHELFAVLRELDAAAVRLIWVETPPPEAAWDGVRDRLSRAAA